MTPRERVLEVLKMPWRPDPDPYSPGRREFLYHEELESRLEQAITAAVEEEREAAIEIAKRVGQSQGAFLGDWPTAELIVKLIRARSDASRSAEPAEK